MISTVLSHYFRELLERFAKAYDSFGTSSGIEGSDDQLRDAIGPLAQSLDSKSVVNPPLNSLLSI